MSSNNLMFPFILLCAPLTTPNFMASYLQITPPNPTTTANKLSRQELCK